MRIKKYFDVWVFGLSEWSSASARLRFTAAFGCFPDKKFKFTYVPTMKAIFGLFRLPDLIVFNRFAYPLKQMNKIMEFASRNGIPAILDIDDLLTEMPDRHIAHDAFIERRQIIIDLLKKADVLTVSTSRLKESLSIYNRNIELLPNFIENDIWFKEFFIKDRDNGRLVIGYAGSITHDYDFKTVIPAIRNILSRHPGEVSFKFIGFTPVELRDLPGVESFPGSASYREYAQILSAGNFDLVLAPLEDNEFNSSKSNIKFLEYSICGYPGIYSAVGPYLDSVVDGQTGLLVNHDAVSWEEAMEKLICDPGLRLRLGKNAREHVKTHYVMDDKWKSWYDLYSLLVINSGRKPQWKVSGIPFFVYGPYAVYDQLWKIYWMMRRRPHG